MKGNFTKPGKIGAFMLESMKAFPGRDDGLGKNFLHCLVIAPHPFNQEFHQGQGKFVVGFLKVFGVWGFCHIAD